jgi:5-carboxymethyl-2-hydroxymuconate isomerase
MPHCIIEYSSNIESIVDVPALLKSVYQGALASSLFAPEDIKCRAIPYMHSYIGESSSDFIHVVLKILQGRNEQQKADLSVHVLKALKALPFTDISITVEVVDIEVSSYQKEVRSESC